MSASEICLVSTRKVQLLALHYMKGKRGCFDVRERTSLHYEKSLLAFSMASPHPFIRAIHTARMG